VLKIDVEGYEYFALRGGCATLRRARPAVLCELNGLHRRYGLTDALLLDFFSDLDYRPCTVDASLDPRPLDRAALNSGGPAIGGICENLLFLPREALP